MARRGWQPALKLKLELELELTEDPRAFARRAGAFLSHRLECNLLATVLEEAVRGRSAGVFGTVCSAGEVVGAALRTSGRPLLCGPLPTGAAAPLLDAWLDRDPSPPGVFAAPDDGRAIADRWTARTGAPVTITTRLALHALDTVSDPLRPGAGALRRAADADLELTSGWWHAFCVEAMPGTERHAQEMASTRVADGRVYLWEHAGEPGCLVGVHPAVAGVVRIGPVYTPPGRRRRGYASSAVATVSRLMLATVAQRCLLFTDLANPTSNRIYGEVGYRRFAEIDEYRFEGSA